MSLATRILTILRSHARQATDATRARPSGPSKPNEPPDEPATQPRGEASGSGPVARLAPPGDLATFYANLEIAPGASRDEVEAAWKRQVRRYHPDRHASNPQRQAIATELLQGINHAYTEICSHLAPAERS